MTSGLKNTKRFGPWFLLPLTLLTVSCSSASSSKGPGVYPKTVTAADEGFAIQSLRMIATAQAQAKVTRGAYGDFNSLVGAGLLDQRFASTTPTLKGYQFSMTASDNEFLVHADPQITESVNANNARHFYMDASDNSIHVNVTQSASKSDPIL